MYNLVYGQERWSHYDWSIAVVGCGGTGSLVAEGLCRLLLPQPDMKLVLVDHDRVEPHNLLRQAFYQGDVGRFKAEVLATRLAKLFDRPIGYSVQEFSQAYYGSSNSPLRSARIVIGCVDNPMARGEIAAAVRPTRWWIDAGNAETLGQVLVGNASSPDALKGAFDVQKNLCYALPSPTVQRPELLMLAEPTPLPVGMDPDCAEAIQLGGQSPVINQVMAALVLEVVRRVITGTCPWMGLYLNLERGELRAVDATPENAARAFGLRSHRALIAQEKRR
jgi:PRTRC genetic system ThiF family protein